MEMSSEIFVMVVFIIGTPIVYFTLRDSELPAHHLFMTAYLLLLFSNIFTVVEGFLFYSLLNFLEHLFITFAAFTLLAAVIKLTARERRKQRTDNHETVKE
jgi:membrane protein implicated in regulation of membrane protease activity